jgi:DNA repair exonuclease SbcCD nuclease subunit
MSKPYLILSDLHFHSWSQFAETGADGINSRLRQLIEAMNFAVNGLAEAGGKTIFLAGDVFHKRGEIAPSVLNPVMDAFERYVALGFEIHAIPGNHDLEKNESDRVGNSITALESVGVTVYHQPGFVDLSDENRTHLVCMFPWFSSVKDLLREMDLGRSAVLTRFDGDIDVIDAIIHAPVDGVLPHLPSHGLEAGSLSRIGFDKVFSGHYHNHVALPGDVYSVGAMTHQTWGDIGSKAGFLLVDGDEVKHFETHHPKFVELTGDETDEQAEALCQYNYVRVRAVIEKDEELKEIREGVLKLGARGVTVIPVRTTTVTRAGSTASSSGISIESSIKTYLDKKGASPKAHAIALEILSEARSA